MSINHDRRKDDTQQHWPCDKKPSEDAQSTESPLDRSPPRGHKAQAGKFHFFLPESFLPAEFLRSPELRFAMNDARFFIHTILTKMARGAVDGRGYVRLKAEYLRNIMHQGTYAAVIRALVDGGAVEKTSSYTPGEYSYGYKLSDRFLHDKHVRVPIRDERLLRRLQLSREEAEVVRQKRMKPVHLELERRQRRLEIDGNKARQIIAGLPEKSNPYDVQGILISAIERKEFRSSVSQYGRWFNSITGLKREVRSTLHVGGEPLVGVDINCSQPSFIALLIQDHGFRSGSTGRGEGKGETRGRQQGRRYICCYT